MTSHTLCKTIPQALLLLGTAVIFLLCSGCGFHLRGAFNISPLIQFIKIEPDQPSDPFQRILKQVLKQNGVTVVECGPAKDNVPTLRLSNLNFVERPVAYGSDVQVNRSTLQLNVAYEIIDPKGCVLLEKRSIDMERDLTIVPNSVLGTESERNHVKDELYNDVATLLIRQLSLFGDCFANCSR